MPSNQFYSMLYQEMGRVLAERIGLEVTDEDHTTRDGVREGTIRLVSEWRNPSDNTSTRWVDSYFEEVGEWYRFRRGITDAINNLSSAVVSNIMNQIERDRESRQMAHRAQDFERRAFEQWRDHMRSQLYGTSLPYTVTHQLASTQEQEARRTQVNENVQNMIEGLRDYFRPEGSSDYLGRQPEQEEEQQEEPIQIGDWSDKDD